MAYISQTEQAILKVEVGDIIANSKLLKGIIERDKASQLKREMREGEAYYEGKHAILDKNFQIYFVDGRRKENKNKANNKVMNPFYTDLVDQKKDYMLGKEFTITSENEKFIKKITNKDFREKLDETADDLCVNASNKGREWLHYFINDQGKFDYIIAPAEQIIPDYDNSIYNKMLSIMRYYMVDYLDEKGVLKQKTKVEIWTDTQVCYYIETEKGEFVLDASENPNPRPHWVLQRKEGEVVTGEQSQNWGVPPFIELLNNKKGINDLRRIKSLIDVYDVILTGFANQIEDNKEIHVVVKNYSGTDEEEMVRILKESGIIKVDGEGDAKDLQLTIPVEAKEKALKILEQNIYKSGRGFNLSDENFAGQITGVALKYKYAALDMKASAMIKQFKKLFKELLKRYAQFIGMAEDYATDKLEITFNRTVIINETEAIDNVANSTDLSKKTRLANHPWVNDVDKELELISEEEQGIDLNKAEPK